MEYQKNIKWITRLAWTSTAVVIIYTVVIAAFSFWARTIAAPTAGGISASEIVEGFIPGGFMTLLELWIVLSFITISVWVWYAFTNKSISKISK